MTAIWAPWTPEQVAALNEFQRRGQFHPFTCGGDHVPGSPVLVAREDGWHCSDPYGEGCAYRQNWAHSFMAAPEQWSVSLQERFQPVSQKPRQVSAEDFRERVVQNLTAEAHACEGPPLCKMTETGCWDAHPLNWTATVGGVALLDGPTTAIADVAVRVARELGLLPPE